MNIRNRIKKHVRVKASELVPHELNPRLHSDEQRSALSALYRQIGFARSLLAYELPDGRLKLIDGHLRQSLEPDMEVDVEVLDVTDDEARALLLSIDPLAQLANFDDHALDELRRLTATDDTTLAALWASLRHQDESVVKALNQATKPVPQHVDEQYHVLIECASEEEQVELLDRLHAEGLRCRALTA